LLPWLLEEKHRWLFTAQMLRAEARRREGKKVREDERGRLERFVKRLKDGNLVVHYDRDTEEGFLLVPRREGIDTDLIRVPSLKTTVRPRVD
jgi:hypothetical protein